MPRQGQRPTSCRGCGVTAAAGARISWHGLCEPCGDAIELINLRELRAKEGPFYDHWLYRLHLATIRRLHQRQSTTA